MRDEGVITTRETFLRHTAAQGAKGRRDEGGRMRDEGVVMTRETFVGHTAAQGAHSLRVRKVPRVRKAPPVLKVPPVRKVRILLPSSLIPHPSSLILPPSAFHHDS